MTSSGASFSIATTVFVSLAICAVISYGVFYYFKQRLAVIEHSQMEQARILQAIISRGLAQHAQGQQGQQGQPPVQQGQPASAKEITITQNGLIEVSSDDSSDSESESESDSDSDSHSSDSDESESKGSDKWSIGDEIHQPDGYFEEFEEKFKKNILIDAICIDSSYVVDGITISATGDDTACEFQQKIISLNKGALVTEHDSDDGDDDDDTSSSSSEDPNDKDNDTDKDNDKDNDNTGHEFELKIGYKPAKAVQLNYGNMAVPALRQLAKERGLGGDDADLQKLKKKDLVQLLQWMETLFLMWR